MQALLNGLTGTGLLFEKSGGVTVVRLNADPSSVNMQGVHAGSLGDARHVDGVEVADANEALALLSAAYAREESLDLALMLFDRDLSPETRTDAAAALNRLLLDWDIRKWLEGVLYGAPLPAGADLEGARRHGSEGGSAVSSMLGRLLDLQPVIRRVQQAWGSVCARVLPQAARAVATSLAARGGVFRELVFAAEGAGADWFRFVALRVLQPMSDHRRLIDELTSELNLSPIKRRNSEQPLVADLRESESREEPRKPAERVSFDRTAAFEKVVRQKQAIVHHMQNGRLDLVRRFVDELVDYQLPLDHRGELTSKSLCDLAMEAKKRGLFQLQRDLAGRAIEVRYEDGWAWAQLGDAFIQLGSLEEASEAYRHASDFGQIEVGRTGRAQVLKAMGRLDDALAAYDAVSREFPENVFAKNGRAEVLKAMGRLDDALAAYDAVGREFPSDVVARTGRAEVLKAMGRLDEALAAYDTVGREFPENVVARTGRAEVLKAMGHLDDALAAYDAVGREFPENVFAKNGRAEVLKAMGRLGDALAAYDAVGRQFPSDVVAKTGRAEVLKAMGRLDDALAAFDAIGREFPENVVARTGRAEVLKAMGRLDDALAAYDAVGRQFPENVFAKNGRAEVLKAMGRLDDALAAYDAVGRQFPSDVVARNGRAEVLKAMGRLDDALAAYDAVRREFPSDVVARSGRAEVLKAMGRLDDALAAYDAVAREFPSDVVAKNGRAEVLKAMGRLDEALGAYLSILSQHPTDAVARNGRASVLCTLGRYGEILELLPENSPTTSLEDWIGLHIVGMALFRLGRIEESAEIFKRGLCENPYAECRPAFQYGLALANLRRHAYDDALRIINDVIPIGSDRVAGFLRAHGAGALGDRHRAGEFLRQTGEARNPLERDLKAELERRFVKSEPPVHDDDWLFQHEVDCLLLAA